MSRFRVGKEEVGTGSVRLRGTDLHRLRDVLRLPVGAEVELFDGEGAAVFAEIVSVGRSAAELSVLRAAENRRESPLALTLAVAVVKGAKLDWVVEKAAELGVFRISPFTSQRTVPERESFAERGQRWRRIADAAAAQSGRSRSPEIAEVVPLSSILAARDAHERAILFWEEGGEPLVRGHGANPRSALVVTGPEGGFSAAEAAQARGAGFAIASFGPRILRAETAAVAAVTLAQFLWGDLGARH